MKESSEAIIGTECKKMESTNRYYSKFIAIENQTLLWKTINKSQLFNKLPPEERPDWFKNAIGYIYFERDKNFFDTDDLTTLNKKTVHFMLTDLKVTLEHRRMDAIRNNPYFTDVPKDDPILSNNPSEVLRSKMKESTERTTVNHLIKDGDVSYFSGRDSRPESKKQKGVSLGATPPMGETLVSLQMTGFSGMEWKKMEAEGRYQSEAVIKKELCEQNAAMFDMKQKEFNSLIANNTPPQIDFSIKEMDEPIEDMSVLIERCVKERNDYVASFPPLSLDGNSGVVTNNL